MAGLIKGTIAGTKKFLHRRSALEIALGATALVLVADHMIAPKGMSIVTKTTRKISGVLGGKGMARALPLPPPHLPAVIPPPGAIHAGVDYTGANAQAGWNRGMSPSFPGAYGAPGGPWPYAHAGQHYGWE